MTRPQCHGSLPLSQPQRDGGTMATATAKLVQQRQNPLRERYRRVPAEAWICDGAQTINGCGGDPFHGAVIPANNAGAPLCFGIHRAVGGDHDYPNPGDLLSAALAACFDSTLRMVADHLGVRLRSLEVEVEAECDVRGMSAGRALRSGRVPKDALQRAIAARGPGRSQVPFCTSPLVPQKAAVSFCKRCATGSR